MIKLTQRVAHYIARHNLMPKGERVAVALSGGADSVALLLVLRELGYKTVALHCNFHLRGEDSNADETFVRDLCAQYHIALHVQHFDTRAYAAAHSISLEMAAREQRYDWFPSAADAAGCSCIAVAHHTDDQAETLLLNLIRGTGLRGLCAMQPRNGRIVRPLLCARRSEVEDYLAGLGQRFVTDRTNLKREVRRNVIRLDVMPLLESLNPDVVFALASLSDIVRHSLPFYAEGVKEAMKRAGVEETSFPRTLLTDEQSNARTLLFEWLYGKGFRSSQIEEVMRSATAHAGAMWQSPTHRLLLDRHALLLASQPQPFDASHYKVTITPCQQMKLPPAPMEIYCDADSLSLPLTLRPVAEGDSFVPFGMKGRKLVSDYLTNCKLNRFAREVQLVLCSGDDIVWLVGLRADDRFKVTRSTKNILRITINTVMDID